MKDKKAIITLREPFDKLIAVHDHPRCRTRSQPIRTAAQIEVKIKISLNQTVPVYQMFAPKIKKLKALGMSNNDIAKTLKINRKTVKKGLDEVLYQANSKVTRL